MISSANQSADVLLLIIQICLLAGTSLIFIFTFASGSSTTKILGSSFRNRFLSNSNISSSKARKDALTSNSNPGINRTNISSAAQSQTQSNRNSVKSAWGISRKDSNTFLCVLLCSSICWQGLLLAISCISLYFASTIDQDASNTLNILWLISSEFGYLGLCMLIHGTLSISCSFIFSPNYTPTSNTHHSSSPSLALALNQRITKSTGSLNHPLTVLRLQIFNVILFGVFFTYRFVLFCLSTSFTPTYSSILSFFIANTTILTTAVIYSFSNAKNTLRALVVYDCIAGDVACLSSSLSPAPSPLPSSLDVLEVSSISVINSNPDLREKELLSQKVNIKKTVKVKRQQSLLAKQRRNHQLHKNKPLKLLKVTLILSAIIDTLGLAFWIYINCLYLNAAASSTALDEGTSSLWMCGAANFASLHLILQVFALRYIRGTTRTVEERHQIRLQLPDDSSDDEEKGGEEERNKIIVIVEEKDVIEGSNDALDNTRVTLPQLN